MDRRTTIQWMLAAAASIATLPHARSAESAKVGAPSARGYGTDPNLTRIYKPGELWPLTFTPAQRRTATALCDVIIPADTRSPSASAVGVVDFLDEWVSAPYPQQKADRDLIVSGLTWMEAESMRRFKKGFADAGPAGQQAICNDICYEKQAKAAYANAAKFFARYRDLTAGGFYTTPEGRKDLQYVGNVPLPRFDGPPLEVLRKVGLA